MAQVLSMLILIKTSILGAFGAKFGLDPHISDAKKQTPLFLFGRSFYIYETHRYLNIRKKKLVKL